MVKPAAFNRLSTPVNPSVLSVVAALVIPIASNAFCADCVGLTKLTIACLIPLTAVSVLTPLIVTLAMAAFNSFSVTPALAAIGATLPS